MNFEKLKTWHVKHLKVITKNRRVVPTAGRIIDTTKNYIKNHAESAPPRRDMSTISHRNLESKGSNAQICRTPPGLPKRLPRRECFAPCNFTTLRFMWIWRERVASGPRQGRKNAPRSSESSVPSKISSFQRYAKYRILRYAKSWSD